MADLSDVLQAWVNLIASVVYPNGLTSPSIVSPTVVKIGYGWPIPGQLDADLLTPKNPPVTISVWNLPGDRNVTRHMRKWWPRRATVAPTVTATVSGSVVTIAGTITVGNYVTIVTGNQSASHIIVIGDTLASIAAALVAQFSSPVGCSAYGSIITFTTAGRVVARCAAPQTVNQEVERLQKRFQITIWSASDVLRDLLGAALRPVIMATASLPLPNGMSGRIWPVSDMADDSKQRAQGFLRDMIYTVEYATLITETQYPVTTIQDNEAAVIQPIFPPLFAPVPTDPPDTFNY